MAEQERDNLLAAYPKMGAYIRAARKRGYSDEEIDSAISQGMSARRKAGKSLEEINSEFGVTSEPTRGEKVQSAWGNWAGGLASGEGDILGREYKPENSLFGPDVGKAISGAYQRGDGALSLTAQGINAVPAFKQAETEYRGVAEPVAKTFPQLLAEVTSDDIGAATEALLSGVLLPGNSGGGLPGTESANQYYEQRYPGMGPLLRDVGPSKLELGFPIPAAGVPIAERAAATVLPKLGRAAAPLAIAGEMMTFGPDFTGSVPGRAAEKIEFPRAQPPVSFTEQMGPAPVPRLNLEPRRLPDGSPSQIDPFVDLQDATQRAALEAADPQLTRFSPVKPPRGQGAFQAEPTLAPTKPGVLDQTPTDEFTAHDVILARRMVERANANRFFEEGPNRVRAGQVEPTLVGKDPFGPFSDELSTQVKPRSEFIDKLLESDAPLTGPVTKKGKPAARKTAGPSRHYTNWLADRGLTDSPAARQQFISEGGMNDVVRPAKSLGSAGPEDLDIPDLTPAGLLREGGFTRDPRSTLAIPESLAKVPGSQVVDSTRIVQHPIWRANETALQDARGRTIGGPAADPADFDIHAGVPVDETGYTTLQGVGRRYPTGDGKLNPAAFPDRLPMGDRQPGASGKVTVEGPYTQRGTMKSTDLASGASKMSGTEQRIDRPVRMEGGETFVPERPFNRAGQELDPRKMQARERMAQLDASQAKAIRGGENERRLGSNEAANLGDQAERQRQLRTGKEASIHNEVPALEDLVKSEADFSRRLDDLSTKFSAMPGAEGIDEAVESAAKAAKELLGKLESTPAQQATKRLIASFQRKKGRTLNKAREEVKAWTREIDKARREGKLTEKEAREGAKAVQEVVKATVAAQNRIHRAVLIRAARKQFPGAARRDILAAAGEIDALSEGLQLSFLQKAGDWIGGGVRTGVGLFKTIKVLGSSTAYANNVGSNLISGYFAGLSPKDVPLLMEAISDLRANGPMTKQAIDAGLFGTEFFSKDLDSLLRELELAGKGKKNAAEMLESFWRTNTGKAAAVYDGIDKVFKLATFKKATTSGISTGKNPFGGVTKLDARAAVEHVNLYFPNYERLGPGAQRFRKATTTALAINPFLAFPLEYARIYKNVAINKPFHLAAGVGAVGGLALYGELGTGVDRPEYHSLPSKLSVPIPFTKDSRGKPRFMDLTYVVPLADTFSNFRRDPGKSWSRQILGSAKDPNSGLFTSAVAGLLTRGIISPQDEKFTKPGEPGFFGSVAQLATNPSLETGQQLLRAQPVPFGQKLGALGRKRAYGEDPTVARELGEFASFRMLPDSGIEKKRAKGEFEGKERDLQMQIGRIKNDKSLTRDERLSRMDKIQDELRQLRRSR